MIFEISLVSVSFIFLLLIIYFQKKFNFCIDEVSKNEKHKFLLSLDNKVPLTGSFYFIPVIFFLTYRDNLSTFFVASLFLFIGLLSDLKLNSSPKLRLTIQFIALLAFIFFNKNFIIDTRIIFFDKIFEYEFFRILIISFFFLVLINGYNFIDGANCLCSLNFLFILIFLYLVSKDIDALKFAELIKTLVLTLLVFILLNFFGKTFLGDSGVYVFSFFLGVLVIKLSLLNKGISPYFIANLLWYPAFENLFSISRRLLSKKKIILLIIFIYINYYLYFLKTNNG